MHSQAMIQISGKPSSAQRCDLLILSQSRLPEKKNLRSSKQAGIVDRLHKHAVHSMAHLDWAGNPRGLLYLFRIRL